MQNSDVQIDGSRMHSPYTALLSGSDTTVATSGARLWKEDPLTCLTFNVNLAFIIVLITALADQGACASKTSDLTFELILFLAWLCVISAFMSGLVALVLSLTKNSIALLCSCVPISFTVAVVSIAVAFMHPNDILETSCGSSSERSWLVGALGVASSQILLIVCCALRRRALVKRAVDVANACVIGSRQAQPREMRKMLICAAGMFVIFGFPAAIETIVITLLLD